MCLQDASEGSENPGDPPPFLDKLVVLYCHTPQDRGTLIWAGGVRERTPTLASDGTPLEMSQDHIGGSSVGQSSKRPARDIVVDSPRKKQSTSSLDDCMREIKETVVAMREGKKETSQDQDKLHHVIRILEEDGIHEGTTLYCKAIHLCKNKLNRMAFLSMKTP